MIEARDLDGLAGLTLWRTSDGRWQASTTTDRVSWRVVIRDEPGEAILAVLNKTETEEPEQGDVFG